MTVYSELSKIGNTVSYIIVVITATNFFKNYSYNSLNKNQHFIFMRKMYFMAKYQNFFTNLKLRYKSRRARKNTQEKKYWNNFSWSFQLFYAYRILSA